MKILTINPGSTSTKIGLFEDERALFVENIKHDVSELSRYEKLFDQLEYRENLIRKFLERNDIVLSDIDAYVGRGGGLIAMEGGVYEIDEAVLEDSARGANGVQHPALLGPHLAKKLADIYQKPAFVVNPPDVDELQDVARMTGIKDNYRTIHLHALNLKETAMRHSKRMNCVYEDSNYIVCHIGGGISVSAHRKGKMIDGNDISGGEGPMSPTRCGSMSVSDILDYCEKTSITQARSICVQNGGMVSWFGTSDALEISDRAKKGDRVAELFWNSMIYQIIKCIGSMAAALKGNVDGILLGGGMVYNENLVKQIKECCQFIAPVYAYPGEFEMEAMAAGAVRVLRGVEKIKKYTGKPVWIGI